MKQPSTHASRGTLLLLIFVLSGFAGLIYQSIWTQYLGLFLGHSSYAQSLVLVLFMGGMALGAWSASRYTELLKRPLLIYAAIELIVGVMGLTFDPLYALITNTAYENIFPSLQEAHFVTASRWAISIFLVLPACILLGATFPLMSAGFLRIMPTSGGEVLSGLYFSNSIGAAAGVLAATYFLLPNFGLPGTVMTAGLLNILVAIAVYPLGKDPSPAISLNKECKATTTGTGLILTVAALTGASSFIYEIVWIRMLSLAVGTTLHAFELMLAAFISGIAFGGLWLRKRADRMTSPLRMAGWVQIFMGLAALSSLFIYANSFEWVGWMMRVIVHTAEGYGAYNFATGIISLAVMFPTAFFAGMTLPLLTLSLLRAGGGERAIGRVYAANTLGAIFGVLLAVHLLMPMLGVKFALWLAAAVDLGLGLVLLNRITTWRAERPTLALASTISIVCLGASFFIKFDPLVLASSVYRTGATMLQNNARMLFYRDGKTASVAVYESGLEDSRRYAIATNGKVDAGLSKDSSAAPGSDEFTMTLLPALPLALHSHPTYVGVIGFGSGMTTHTLLGSSRVQRVDTIEIEPAMVEGAKTFAHIVGRAFNDPRSNVIIDDAKSYFSASRARYDLIISEPSNPWMGGTASLFTEQFYEFIPRHLNDDGLFVQWLQLYEITPTLVTTVLSAMLPHFNDVNAYLANSGDLILIASPTQAVPTIPQLDSDPALRKELRRIGIETNRDLLDGYVMNRAALAAYTKIYPAQPNSDFFPILQLKAPEARFMRSFVKDFEAINSAPWPLARHLGGFNLRSFSAALPDAPREIAIDRKLRAAQEIREALISGNPIQGAHASQSDATQMEALRGLAQRCMLDDSPAQAAQMIFSLAMETVAFLTPQDQEGLWINPAWIECPPSHPLVTGALDFVRASAEEHHLGVISAGRELLNGNNSGFIYKNANSSYYVRGGMQFSALALEDRALASSLVEDYDAKLSHEVRSQPLLRLLSALSQ